MKAKCAPVHSIEPQILQAALQAKKDGIEMMFVGESSDLIFGGMDGLLAKDWDFDEFVNRLKRRSFRDFGVDVSGKDQILTLSTCSNADYRVAIHAKKIVEEKEQNKE